MLIFTHLILLELLAILSKLAASREIDYQILKSYSNSSYSDYQSFKK
jgi:hypothetical protein